MIHGDYSPYNVLVDPGTDSFVTGVIDFGDSMRSALIFDPAVSLATPRDYNKARVLDVVLSHALLTRNKLIELTGLSKATVSRAVEDLRSDGFVVDGGATPSPGVAVRRRTLMCPRRPDMSWGSVSAP